MKEALTFVLMDPPFESFRTTIAMRMIDAALRRGVDVNVFAYEGAVYLPFLHQSPHANSIHGHSVEEEAHPLPKDWLQSLQALAEEKGCRLDWVNCGLCVDERGAKEAIGGVRRGSPADLAQFADQSINTIIIPTR